jgi:hypothetical protein
MHPHNVVYNPGTMVRLAEQSTPPASARRWTPVTSCGRASNPCGQSKRWAISCTAQPRRTSASHSAAGTPCTLSRWPPERFLGLRRRRPRQGLHRSAPRRRVPARIPPSARAHRRRHPRQHRTRGSGLDSWKACATPLTRSCAPPAGKVQPLGLGPRDVSGWWDGSRGRGLGGAGYWLRLLFTPLDQADWRRSSRPLERSRLSSRD